MDSERRCRVRPGPLTRNHARIQPGESTDGRRDPAGQATSLLASGLPRDRGPSGSSSSGWTCSRNRPANRLRRDLGQRRHRRGQMPDGSARYFNGIVNRFTQGELDSRVPMGHAFFIRYQAEIVPQFWLLTRKAAEPDLPARLPSRTSSRRCCTGLDVDLSRSRARSSRATTACSTARPTSTSPAGSWKKKASYYFFKHADGSHKMVVANTPAEPPRRARAASRSSTRRSQAATGAEDRIHDWEKVQEIRVRASSRSGTTASSCPHKHLEADKTIADTRRRRARSPTSSRSAATTSWRSTTTPASYAQRFDGIDPGGGEQAGDLQKIFEDNKRTVDIRMQQEAAASSRSSRAASNCRQFIGGPQVHAREALQRRRRLRPHRRSHTSPTHGEHLHVRRADAFNLREHVHVHPRRAAVPAGRGRHAEAAVAGHADGRRRRPAGRGDLHRQVRPREGAVPLGPRGQERRRQLLLDPRRHASGPASTGASSTSPASARKSSSTSWKATPISRSSSAASTTPTRCRPTTCPANKTQSGIKTRSSKGGRRQLQRDPLRGQEGLRADLHPRREEPGHRGRERRDPLGRPRPQEDHRPRRDHPRQARPHRDGRQQRDDHDRRESHRDRRTRTRRSPSAATAPSPSTERVDHGGARRAPDAVGVNEAITVGAAQEITVGGRPDDHGRGAQAITVGAAR